MLVLLAPLLVVLGIYGAVETVAPAIGHATGYFSYPCNYPFVGTAADVNVIVEAGGQFCDGPTEINWTHYHCWSAGVTVNIGAIAFAPIPGAGGASLGGFGGNGIGGSGGQCRYVCPDGMIAPFPNPPAVWVKHLVLEPKNDDCVGHHGSIGPTSDPLPNQLPGNMAPGEDAPPGVAVPVEPGGLPEGQRNPDAKVGIPPPVPQVPGAGVPLPSGKAVTPSNNDESPLTPGSPMALP